jgi:hypothetical protein
MSGTTESPCLPKAIKGLLSCPIKGGLAFADLALWSMVAISYLLGGNGSGPIRIKAVAVEPGGENTENTILHLLSGSLHRAEVPEALMSHQIQIYNGVVFTIYL